MTLETTIARLDRHIATARPTYYAQLGAPLDDAAITALEAHFGVVVPEDLKALYRWKNGQQHDCHASFVNNAEFLPLADALESAKELTSMIGSDFESPDWWRAGWFPIFHNGGGDHICYDAEGAFTGEPGQLLEFWHADSDRNVIAPDLASFLQSLAAYYEATPVAAFNNYFEVKPPAGFPKSFEA